jgi:hypothetical protein
MTLPIQPSRIKAKAACDPLAVFLMLGLSLVGAAGLTACRAQVAQAPFPVRPDTVVPGDLRGPFDGRVIDSASGNPVPAALVIGTWAYRSRGAGDNAAPVLSQTVTAVTNPDGTYTLPATALPSDPAAVLRSFTLVVYKAGYTGYRSDLRFEDRYPRHDFAQRQNRVLLTRFPEGRSHAAHLAFLGGGAALRQASMAEHVQAALDLAEAQPKAAVQPHKEPKKEPPPLPQAATLLPASDVQALMAQAGVKGVTHVAGPLTDNISGQPHGPSYQSVHYRAMGKAEAFDVALRLWRPGDAAALFAQIGKNLSAFLQKDKGPPQADERTLVAFDPKRRIHGLVALLPDREPPLVMQLTCGASLCPKKEGARKLLQQALDRLPK